MSLSRFFVSRPKFAFVISIVITIAGSLALMSLPVVQFPEMTPPTVSVSTQHAGASSESRESAPGSRVVPRAGLSLRKMSFRNHPNRWVPSRRSGWPRIGCAG